MLRVSAIAALALASSVTSGAEAAIRCEGPYQIIQGNLLATPWCQDNYLAAVARSYGVRVSDSAIRNNPNVKAETCRFIGSDNRVRDICQGYLPGRGRGIAF